MATPQAQAAPSAESTPAADATLVPGIDGANIMGIEEAPSDTKRPLWGTSLATCSQSPWNFVLVGWFLAFMSLGVGGVAKSAQLSLVTADGRPLQQAALVGAAAPGAVLLQPDAVQTPPAPTVPAPLQSLAAAARLDPVAMPLPGGQQSLAPLHSGGCRSQYLRREPRGRAERWIPPQQRRRARTRALWARQQRRRRPACLRRPFSAQEQDRGCC